MVKELVLEAVRKNELVECLEGKGNYKIEIGQWVNAYAPTDWTIIIPKGIYVVYRENPELQINKEFEGALLKMIGGDSFDIFVAISVFYSKLLEENRGDAPFCIDRNRILPSLRKALLDNEQKLKSNFEYVGKTFKDGIWGEVVRIDTLCKSKWNLSVL